MPSTRWFATAIIAVTAAALPVSARAQDIDTRNVDSHVWGGEGIYGQSFTVGSSTTLNSFSFWVGANNQVGPYQFYSQLFAWNGSSISGSALYTSGIFNAVCCDDLVPPRFDFNVSSLELTSGAQYLALIARTDPGGLKLGYVVGPSGVFIDSYTGGEFFGGYGFAGPPDPTTATYFAIQFEPGNDLMFVADFDANVVPEPSSLALLVTGVVVLGLSRRRRSRAGPWI